MTIRELVVATAKSWKEDVEVPPTEELANEMFDNFLSLLDNLGQEELEDDEEDALCTILATIFSAAEDIEMYMKDFRKS